MTRLALVLLACVFCAGCAATSSRGVMPNAGTSGQSVAPGGAHPLNAQADSAWLAFTAPRYGGGCEPDTAKPLRGGVTVTVLRLNEVQPPFYRRGIEADSAGWDSVRVFNVPVVAARLIGRAPGERCSVRVAAGLYTTVTSNVAGSSCWSRYVRVN